MEGKTVLILGLVSFILLVAIVTLFLSNSGTTRQYNQTTTLQPTTSAKTTIYNQNPTTVTYSTTIPETATDAWRAFNNDLNKFASVDNITMSYNAIEKTSSIFKSQKPVTFYKSGFSASFDTLGYYQNSVLPIRFYMVGDRGIACAQLPSSAFAPAVSCAKENIGFPNMFNFTSLNASAYSNVVFAGTETIYNDRCDAFNATVSYAEAERLLSNYSIPNGAGYDADICINNASGYIDYMSLKTSSGSLATLRYIGSFDFVSNASVLSVPTSFTVGNTSCTANSIRLNFVPFYSVKNPTFQVHSYAVNTSYLNSQMSDLALTLNGILSILNNSTVLNELNNSQNSEADAALANSLSQQYSSNSMFAYNSTGNASTMTFHNITINTTVNGTFDSMHGYQVNLTSNSSLFPVGGIQVCSGGYCQAVSNC